MNATVMHTVANEGCCSRVHQPLQLPGAIGEDPLFHLEGIAGGSGDLHSMPGRSGRTIDGIDDASEGPPSDLDEVLVVVLRCIVQRLFAMLVCSDCSLCSCEPC